MKSHRLVENIQGSSTTDSTLIQSRVLHSPLSCRQIPRSILDPAPERRRGGRSREREAGKTLGKKAQPHTVVQPGSGSDHGMCPPEPLHIVGVCFSSLWRSWHLHQETRNSLGGKRQHSFLFNFQHLIWKMSLTAPFSLILLKVTEEAEANPSPSNLNCDLGSPWWNHSSSGWSSQPAVTESTTQWCSG